ncbi:gamma-glutamyltranspeptidase 1 [Prunus yedoensis var. nudiflora]|uniref:Glutathione hydrolase n=1 Tax=Prunus yedoensis var. nudiflora TaxID=2094558 RepID=A0A314Y8F5_PRUYE|nr:gamma-glutamyltranspeptidase 1 [Prunus yedoensis var. nudiflora]
MSYPLLLLLLLLLLLVTIILWLPPTSSLDATNSSTKKRREVISGRHAAVATDDGRCSRIGMHVLREGGHAVDASVAAAFCLGVVSPASSGIGGGAFMLIRPASGEAQAFDMRETAPLLASENMYSSNTTLKGKGALSIAIPGELAGLHKAWKQYGRLPWKRLVSPAERLARLGFKISPYLNMQMHRTESGILADEGLRHVFTSNGSLLKTGETCRNWKLAQTLRDISNFGPGAFYNGSIGSKLVRDIHKVGGILTMKDLQNYRVKLRKPISSDTPGFKILAMPPPSGGPPMILMLNILSKYGNVSGVSDPLWVHREIESLKHVFAVRMNLGDPEFVNVTNVLADMLSPKFAEELKKTIYDNRTFDPSHYGGRWNQIHDHGTSHLSIIDNEQNAVSMTTTVNGYFGAQILSSSTGIILNNEMDDFSIPGNDSTVPPPAPPNFIRPGKRPLSSMTPTIVLKDEQLKAVVGASGGAMIIAATAQVLLNHFARGLDPLSSVLAPRVYHQLLPNVVQYENWTTVTGDHFEVPAQIRKALHKKGHVLNPLSGGSICQFIVQQIEALKNNGGTREIVAVSDPRKGGFPAGF